MVELTPRVLADLTWPEVAECVERGAILAIPVGSTEQHGPHLPLSTDTDIAMALCERLGEARDDVLIAPPLAYGSSGEHAGFAGTLSIGQAATELVLVELGRSASETFRRVLLVSSHGGNAEPVGRAASQLRAEGRDVQVFSPRWVGDPHAGGVETDLQLALAPDRVRMDRAVVGDLRPLAEILEPLRERGMRVINADGVLGDPTGATAAAGHERLDVLTADLLRAVDAWAPRAIV